MYLKDFHTEVRADPACKNQSVPDYAQALGRPIKGLSIGVCRNYFFDNLQEDVECAVEQAISAGRILALHLSV